MEPMKYDGKDYELAKFDVAMALKFDSVATENDITSKAEKMYDVCESCIGSIGEIVDGDAYDTCDLVKLVDLYNTINDTYVSNMAKTRNERNAVDVSEAMNLVDKVQSMVGSISN